MKQFTLLIFLKFFVLMLYAQNKKDSIYYSKMSASNTKMISVYNGKYKVFTQKNGVGNINLLLLHGGPENTHEYFENFPENLKNLGITIYFYDQLGSYYSDTPDDSSIWNINRLVEEVEEVRRGLNIDSFYLLGHSWGGMLAELYASKYGNHLKGLILSNVPGFIDKDRNFMVSTLDNIDIKVRYKTTLLPKFTNNKPQIDSIYKGLILSDAIENKTLLEQYNKANDSLFGRTMYYNKTGKIPDPLTRNAKHSRYESFEKYNFDPFSANYSQALKKIKTSTLLISGKNDFVHPEFYVDIKKMMKNAKVRVFICPNGAHFTMWDDSEIYFKEFKKFIFQVERKTFRP